ASADPEATIIFGAVIDDNLEDEIIITVIATGFDRDPVLKKPGQLFSTDIKSSQDTIKKPVIVDEELDGPEIPTFLKRKGFR
ncbi:MAG: cell division protein FtsZ, partial [Clostridiaceae bacterium]|nr:cell division protein FtsZ [Clostridiaceae bacterium]